MDRLHTRMMDSYFGLVQQLYNVGARNFLFLSVPREYPNQRIDVSWNLLKEGNQAVEKSPLMLAQSLSARTSEATQIADFNSKIVSRAATFVQGKSQVKPLLFLRWRERNSTDSFQNL